MNLAIIKTGGKQYVVSAGQKLKIEKLADKPDENVKFDTLLIADEKAAKIEIGRPNLSTSVEGKILEHKLGDKVIVAKYKAKTRFKKRVGHRQPYSLVQIGNF